MVIETCARPVPLTRSHDVESFECWSHPLEQYLRLRALADQCSTKSRTYVLGEGVRVIAYASIVPGVVEAALSCGHVADRRRRQIVPVVVLSRIAVDRRWCGRGVGSGLLTWVMDRGTEAAQVIGARAMVTTPLGWTRSFFAKAGFVPFPGDCYRLYVPLGSGGDGMHGV